MPSYPDEPDIILPNLRNQPRPKIKRLYLILGFLFLIFLFFHNSIPLYTDWLWFGEVGYRNVFSTTIYAKTALFFIFGALFFLVFYGNVRLAIRLAPEETDRLLIERFGPVWGPSLRQGIGTVLLVVGLFFSLWAGRVATNYWSEALEFLNSTAFGKTDPVFHQDISFFIFKLPFINFIQGFLLATLVLTLIAVVGIHVTDRAVEVFSGLLNIQSRVRVQLMALATALAFTMAVGTWLSAFDLVTADNGVFTGAGYVDLHYRLLSIYVQMGLLAITGLLCLFTTRKNSNLRLPAYGVGAWLAAMLILGNLVPAAAQKFSVEPNQLALESQYIRRNIEFTRQGFGLQNVRRVNSFPADEGLTGQRLSANHDTLNNVRLWDHQYIGKVYAQTQTVKPYFRFEEQQDGGGTNFNVDIDRYQIDGRLRQVMLAARELNPDALPREVQNWQNQRLGYTHGYGMVMSPVNRVIGSSPDYLIQGFPPMPSREASDLKVTQPKIYYGQLSDEYIFVDTDQHEYDPTDEATGGTIDNSGYSGRGGIRIGDAPLAKLAFSIRFGDINVLLAKNFRSSSRVLFRREIRNRLRMVAPFLQLDSDPYMVLTKEGRMVWMLDAYTISDKYPYSTAQSVSAGPGVTFSPNYMRNSVKATIDAYDGTINLYMSDAQDPIVRTYAKIYPGLLKPLSEMPADLREHVRYPEDIFRMQRAVYASYHVDDPGVYFRQEDAWAIPNEPSPDQAAGSRQMQMAPYYIIMRLPDLENDGSGQAGEEFVLMSPLAPIRREDQNILGWMCARNDGDHYGELVLYRFPQNRSVNGPTQVISLINSDPIISSALSLLRQNGSDAKFGNMMVIPVERSLLYIAPLYVESTNSAKLPQLQRVAVAFGTRVVMDDSLDAALSRIFTGYTTGSGEAVPPDKRTTPPVQSGAPGTVPSPTAGAQPIPPAVRGLIEQAGQQYDVARQKLKQGDLAGYGTQIKELEKTLTELRRSVH